MAVETDRTEPLGRIGRNTHQQAVLRDAELLPEQPIGRVARQTHELGLVLECAVPPRAAVARGRPWLGDFGDRAVERDAHIAVPGAMAAHQDHRALLDAKRELRAHGRPQLLAGAPLRAVFDVDPLAVQRAQPVGLCPASVGGQHHREHPEGCEKREHRCQPSVRAHWGVSDRVAARACDAPALRRT